MVENSRAFSSHFSQHISKISPIMVENSSVFLVILCQHISKSSLTMVDFLSAFLVILCQHISKFSTTWLSGFFKCFSSHFMAAYFKKFLQPWLTISLSAFLVILGSIFQNFLQPWWTIFLLICSSACQPIWKCNDRTLEECYSYMGSGAVPIPLNMTLVCDMQCPNSGKIVTISWKTLGK